MEHLTKRESAILGMLNEAKGATVSRTEIGKKIFGEEHTASNVVDVHVGNIRRKLGKAVIVTVRSGGYRAGLSKCCGARMVHGGVQCESCGSNGL